MVRPRELQRACVRCQAWLRPRADGRVFVQATTATATATATPTRRRRAPGLPVRPFSTTTALAADSTPNRPADDAADEMETTVRQAKALFGDTLPAGYLGAAEYRLYERLYGAPLRTTAPEDVGFLFAGQASQAGTAPTADKANDPPGTTLLREAGGGFYEVVDYAAEREAEAAQEAGLAEDVAEAEVLVEAEGYAAAQAALAAEAEAAAAAAQAQEAAARPDPAAVGPDGRPVLTAAQTDHIQAVARNQREFDALARLQQDFAAAQAAAAEEEVEEEPEEEEEENEEEEEEDEEEEENEDDDDEPGAVFAADGTLLPATETSGRRAAPRLHPLTAAGKMRTQPATVQLPRAALVAPITQLLKRTDLKHVRLAAEAALGGPGLPHSPGTANLRQHGGRVAQQGVGLSATGGSGSGSGRLSEIEADAFLATVVPFVYASATSVLVEVRRRLGGGWLRGLVRRATPTAEGNDKEEPQALRVLDAGGGGAAVAAWNEVLRAELAAADADAFGSGTARLSSGPLVERTVVVSSETLRQRAARLLDDTTFVPRLPDLLHSAANVARHLDGPAQPLRPRKTYDVVVASHQLLGLGRDHQRRALVANLWAQLNPAGGVLVVVEKAHPRGFEAVAEARRQLLALASEENGTGRIVAPCPHDGPCPMYGRPGLAAGRKDFCHFRQRFARPPFLQTILGKAHRNHEDVQFSYVAVQRGGTAREADVAGEAGAATATDAAFAGYGHVGADDNSHDDSSLPALPRTILPPLKRQGHVILDVCTPAGALERWTVPRSFGKQAYHDARKAQWGDLWALGAKARVPRAVRLGRQARREAAAAEAAAQAVAARAAAAAAGDGDDDDSALEAARRAARSAVAAAEMAAAGPDDGVVGPATGPATRRTTAAEKRAAKRGKHHVVKLGLSKTEDLVAASRARRSKRGGMNSDMGKLLEAVERQLEERVGGKK